VAIESVDGKPNRPLGRRVLSEQDANEINQILQGVVSEGTGTRAQLADGRPVAGKTGTTENYGDAWFVGYLPQLVVAVWVGYPTELRPMLTEFHGEPVAGGTYPALIWRSFVESAIRAKGLQPESFAYPRLPPPAPKRLVRRNGLWGNTIVVSYFEGRGPSKTADCKPNEVEVPNVVGDTYDAARARLAAQPLTPVVVYEPAKAGQRVGVVVRQLPASGRLSSFDKVTLVFAKAVHGTVPKVVGLTVPQARKRLLAMRLRPSLRGLGNLVVGQHPGWDVAAGAGLPVTLFVRVRQRAPGG